MPAETASTVACVLGPTNTGKTHLAIERMLEHGSGVIGLPLRLLAREVYDRVSARVGEQACALLTGEEKRIPPQPRYWICTVEAMPRDLPVDFVAVDEVQLCGHRERGHVFTDRLLHARGRRETYLLGAETMRPLVERLLPDARIQKQARLSTLTGVGSLGLGALPPRTAVVAFSAARVYELAERLRARRGGAAVVLGALSPRARNAQVAMYQAGEVDYLVATDAIGMGLNMDVDCVAFAELRKFDGRQARALEDAELAQIAGRAGRFRKDGSFATLAPVPALPVPVSRAIERHRFPVQERIYWRTSDVDTSSIEALVASLGRRPPAPELALASEGEDLRALLHLGRDPEIATRARGGERVALLWDVCQVPDYRQLQLDDHFQLLAALFRQLTDPPGLVDDRWIERHVTPLDDVEGDVDTLLMRMAFVRTWTYVTHQPGWVRDAETWQERTRGVEDRLSDALHAALVRRFVDASARARRRRATARAASGAGQTGTAAAVAAPRSAPASFADLLREHLHADTGGGASAGAGALAHDAIVDDRVEALIAAPHGRFHLDDGGRILDGDQVLARVVRGVDLLRPEVTLALDGELPPGARLRLQRRLLAWTRDFVAELLAPLAPEDATAMTPAALSAAARGLLYQLQQRLGTIRAGDAREQIRSLTSEDRSALRRRGIRVGRHVVFTMALATPAAVRARAVLCNAFLAPGPRLPAPPPSQVSFPVADDVPDELHAAVNYPAFGGRAIRADLVDGIAARLLAGAEAPDLAGRVGCSLAEVPLIRRAFAADRRAERHG